MNRREAKNDDDAYLARPVGGIIGGEDSGADDEDEFPLVASLDELRRRESTRDSQRRPP
jgi:hypothetical protein